MRTLTGRNLETENTNAAQLLHKEPQVTWEGVSCGNCGSYSGLRDAKIVALQGEVEELRLRLALATGQLVAADRLPC